MKKISGRVKSSKPMSLSKATLVLTTFVAAETGASQPANAYLRRTVEAFNELNQLHRELKGSKPGRKHKRAKEDHVSSRLPDAVNEHVVIEGGKESHKKKKKHKDIEERVSLEFEEERRDKKKRKKAEVDEGGVEHSEEKRSKKKRKKSY